MRKILLFEGCGEGPCREARSWNTPSWREYTEEDPRIDGCPDGESNFQ
jgi:hypothetical protein